MAFSLGLAALVQSKLLAWETPDTANSKAMTMTGENVRGTGRFHSSDEH
jgi:hypothetical protein